MIISLLKDDGTVIDIGAGTGQLTILFVKKLNKNTVYAFEPNPRNFEILSTRIKRFNLSNIVLEQKAVGDFSGKIKLYLNKKLDNASISYIRDYSELMIKVECVSLDKYINDKKIDLIKIDVEGAELKVLKGIQNLLNKPKIVVFEFNPPLLKATGFNPEDLLKFFINKGFYLYEINLDKVSLIYDII